jgi:hypothetical protein
MRPYIPLSREKQVMMIPPGVPLPEPLCCTGDATCPHMVPVERLPDAWRYWCKIHNQGLTIPDDYEATYGHPLMPKRL